MYYLKALTISCLIFCAVASFAFQKVDSLESLLQNTKLSEADSLHLLNTLGFELWTVNPSRSVEVGRKALGLALNQNNEPAVAHAYKVIGVAYWALGDYQLALSNMFESLERYEELNDLNGVGSMLLNIGLVYSEQLSYREAKSYFRKAQKSFQENNREGNIATALTKLAAVLTLEDSLATARDYLNSAIEIHHSNNYRYGLAEAYNRLGIVYRKQGDYNASLDYLYRSRDISIGINDNEGLAKCFVDIGITFLATEQFPQAREFFEHGLEKANSIGSKKWRLEAFRGLANLYELKNNNDSALKYYRAYQILKDSVLDKQKIMAIANLKEEYENRQQVQELADTKYRIKELQEVAKARTIFLVSIVVLFFMTTALIVLFYRNQQLKNKRLKEQQEKDVQLQQMKEEKHYAEVENIRLRQKELERELELKDRELASYAINFLQKNEFISDVNADLQKVKSLSDLDRVKRKLKSASQLDKGWENFKMQFEKVHGSFSDELKSTYPDLSPSDLKLAILLRINLNTKECATILGISPDSVKTARYRLRKKMDIDTEESLFDHLIGFGS